MPAALFTGLAISLVLQVGVARPPPSGLRRTPVVEVVERAGPAVVNIAASSRRTPFTSGRLFEQWERFFGGRPGPREAQSLGSGVIIDADGLVLTNEHVVAGAGDVTVVLADRRSFRAEVIGSDPNFDIAVLRVVGADGRRGDPTRDLPAVEIGTSSDLMIGERVVAIGNPFGLANTVTTGVVSALHRVIEAGDRVYEDFVQTDAAINPGNSGGALLSIEGKLIGINTAIHSEGTGIGFAIPIDKALAIVQEVLTYGEVRPAFTGIIVDPGKGPGARVTAVIAPSPAEKAGLRPGDRIVDLGGQEVRDGRSFRQIERALVPGRARRLLVLRGEGAPIALDLEVGDLDVDRAAGIALSRLGIEVRLRGRFLQITKVEPRSDAYSRGVRSGDLLLGLAGRRIRSEAELQALLAAIYDADQVSTLIGRGGRAYSLSLALGSP